MNSERFTLILERSRMLTPNVRALSFRREDGVPFHCVPGQSITLHLPWQDGELPRSFSIATIPGQSDEVEIAVTQVRGGRATGILLGLSSGARVAASGPFGRFILEADPPARYLLIATGTGVVPYRVMLRELKARLESEQHSAVLLLGARSPDELLFGDEFLALAKTSPAFRWVAHYSRRLSEPPLPHERKGYVQDHLLELEPNPAHDIVYLCGNPNMIDATVKRLQALGFDSVRLRRA